MSFPDQTMTCPGWERAFIPEDLCPCQGWTPPVPVAAGLPLCQPFPPQPESLKPLEEVSVPSVTGLGVRAPYDEDREVLARQMHGGAELMGLAGQRAHPSRILPWSTGACAASAGAAGPGHWAGAGAHLHGSMSCGGGGMAWGAEWLGGHLALTPEIPCQLSIALEHRGSPGSKAFP